MGMTIINPLSCSDYHDLIAKLMTVLQDQQRRERGKVCIVCTCHNLNLAHCKNDYRVVKIPLTT